jgi:general secretion pathway protein C
MMNIRHILTLMNLVLITVMIYLGIDLFYKSWSLKMVSPPEAQATIAPSQGLPPEAPHPASYYRTIVERNLMKTSKEIEPKAAKPEVDLAALKQTELSLKLWGTVAGNDEKAYAVIEDTKIRQQNLYRIGDTVQNATIKMILREKVVLQVDGKDEVLEMEELAGGQGIRRAPLPSRAVAALPTSFQPSAQRITLKRSLIEDSVQDISKLMNEVRITPHMENGQPSGLAVSYIKPNSIFRRMGLRNGDIITGVDGQNIRSVDDALALYENLRTADNVQVQIKRRGQVRNIDYQIR